MSKDSSPYRAMSRRSSPSSSSVSPPKLLGEVRLRLIDAVPDVLLLPLARPLARPLERLLERPLARGAELWPLLRFVRCSSMLSFAGALDL